MWKPGLPYHPDSPERTADARLYGGMCMEIGILFQVVALGGFGFLWAWSGASPNPLFGGLSIAAVLALLIDVGLWRELKSNDPGREGGVLAWMWWAGFVCLGVAGMILIGVLSMASFTALQLLYAIPFLIVGVGTFMAEMIASSLGPEQARSWAMGQRRRHFLLVLCGVALFPSLAAWLTASASIEVMPSTHDTVRAWLDQGTPRRRDCSEWVNGEIPIRVAVTLSGGGYRAALLHSGVLAALDDQCVPIDYLSTVSGGSIVGASYALGVPPREFAERLARRPPRLADDLLSARRSFSSTTQVYRSHFSNLFFGSRTIADLPEFPVLLLNVTNFYAPPERAREFFTNQDRWITKDLEGTRIADAVAASAAFPGVFGPVELRWLSRGKFDGIEGTSIGEHLFVDGGVIENLGTEGLRRYLQPMAWTQWYRERPSILVVSDASAYPVEPEVQKLNPAADETLLRSISLQFDHLHRLMFAELTGRPDLWQDITSRPSWAQYRRAPYPRRFVPNDLPKAGEVLRVYRPGLSAPEAIVDPELYTVNIAATKPETGEMLQRSHPQCASHSGKPASEIQKRVRDFPTLYELATADARDAFWLGYVLGEVYGQAVECSRREISGQRCESQPAAPVVDCRP
jgi:hypothetical protein